MKTRLLLCILILCAAMPLIAQEANEPKTIYIYVEINSILTNTTPGFEPGESHFAVPFLEKLRQVLQEAGVNPVIVASSEEIAAQYPDLYDDIGDTDIFAPEAPTLSLSIRSFFEEDTVYLSPFAAYQFEPLPMGSFGYTAIAIITPEREESLDLAVDMAAGIVLYIARECELALPHLDTVRQDNVFIEDGVLLYGNVRFYMAGCEYMMSNADTAVDLYEDGIDFERAVYDGTADARIMTHNSSINLAWVYAQEGRRNDALRVLNDYADYILPSYSARDIDRFLKRSDLYIDLGAYDAGIADINVLVKQALQEDESDTAFFSDDERARIVAERGWRYARIGNGSAALADFETAIGIDPTYPKVYYWRGILHSLRQDFAAALGDFEQFTELAPDYFNYYEEDLTPYLERAEIAIREIEAGQSFVGQ